MSIETSGHHVLPRPPETHVVQLADVGHETPMDQETAKFRDKMLQKHPWLSVLLAAERALGWRKGFNAGMQNHLELDHINGHPNIPVAFIEALQRGSDIGEATYPIKELGVTVTMTVTSAGTGIPAPNTSAAWHWVRDIVRQVAAAPYCADVIAPLPREIATLAWNADQGIVVVTSPPSSERTGCCVRPISAAHCSSDDQRP